MRIDSYIVSTTSRHVGRPNPSYRRRIEQATTSSHPLYVAQTPARFPGGIYSIADPASPFQPSLASPPQDWAIAAQYSGGSSGQGVSLTPSSATITPGGQVGLSTPGSNGGAYLWITSGALGTISDPTGQSGTNFCSDFSQVTYQSNGSTVTAAASDTV